jgi:two-component system chemotaxis response regulator CheY
LARIFIISGNLLIRTLLKEILSTAGHEIVGAAAEGPSTLATLLAERPEMAILDVTLVRRTGLASLEDLRMLDPALAVIVCSALLERRYAIAALRLGAKGFIVKPFDRQAVVDTVNDVLGLARGDAAAAEIAAAPPSGDEATGGVEEQRDFVRLEVSLPVVLEDEEGEPIETVTADISGGGMLLEGSPLAAGAATNFHLELQEGERAIIGRARVVRVTGDGQTAVQFEHLSIADHERITAFIAEHQGDTTIESPSSHQ